MNQRYINMIINNLDRSNIDPIDRSKVIQFELAKYIAYCLPLPSSPLKSAKMHYTESLRAQTLEKLDAFNEVHVIDYRVTERLVEVFWTARYRAVYDMTSPYALAITRHCFAAETQSSGMAKVATVLTDALDSEITWYLSKAFEVEHNESEHGEVE